MVTHQKAYALVTTCFKSHLRSFILKYSSRVRDTLDLDRHLDQDIPTRTAHSEAVAVVGVDRSMAPDVPLSEARVPR